MDPTSIVIIALLLAFPSFFVVVAIVAHHKSRKKRKPDIIPCFPKFNTAPPDAAPQNTAADTAAERPTSDWSNRPEGTLDKKVYTNQLLNLGIDFAHAGGPAVSWDITPDYYLGTTATLASNRLAEGGMHDATEGARLCLNASFSNTWLSITLALQPKDSDIADEQEYCEAMEFFSPEMYHALGKSSVSCKVGTADFLGRSVPCLLSSYVDSDRKTVYVSAVPLFTENYQYCLTVLSKDTDRTQELLDAFYRLK